MYTEVDVFVSNYTLIDPEIYQLWIEGCSCKHFVYFNIVIFIGSKLSLYSIFSLSFM